MKGQLTKVPGDSTSCKLELWDFSGPFWGEKKAEVEREAEISSQFDVHWTIGGPKTTHWLEIKCEGYEVYRSHKFDAPSENRTVDLGAVTVTPLDRSDKSDV